MKKIVDDLIKAAPYSKQIVKDFVLKEIDAYDYLGCKKEILYALSICSNLYEKFFLLQSVGKSFNIASEKLNPFAIASELLMVGALTGDDIIDNGYLRGKKPTLNVKFGLERAQLVSNIILGFFNSALTEGQENFNCTKGLEAAKYFYKAYNNVFIGQHNLILLQGKRIKSSRVIDKLALSRVGSLFAATCVAPVILSERNDLVKAYLNYGYWLGAAIQHRDDILDYIGEDKLMGKPQFQDLLNAQPNLVTAFLFSKLKEGEPELKIFNKFWGMNLGKNKIPRIPSKMHNDIIYLLESSNALSKSIKHLKKCCNKAIESINSVNHIDKSSLIDFANLTSEIEY